MFSASAIARQEHAQPALVFYKVSAEGPSVVNRMAAYLTGTAGMAHVELRFRDGRSVSVFQDEKVFLKKRGYSNQHYRALGISVPAAQEARMIAFAERQVGKNFNYWGLRRSAVPLLWRTSDGTTENGVWFCSELVLATLQAGGMMPLGHPATSSPNALYDAAVAGMRGDSGRTLNAAIAPNMLALQESPLLKVFGTCNSNRADKDRDQEPQSVFGDLESNVSRKQGEPSICSRGSLLPMPSLRHDLSKHAGT